MNGRKGWKESEKKKKLWRNKSNQIIFLVNETLVSCDEEMKLKVSHTKSPGVTVLSESPLHGKNKRP